MNSEILSRAEKLAFKGEFEESLQLIQSIKQSEFLTTTDIINMSILKGQIHCYRDQFREAVMEGNLAYQANQKLGNPSKSINALILMAHGAYFGEVKKALEHISKAEKLINSMTIESTPDYYNLQANLLLIKSIVYNFKADHNKSLELALQWLELRNKLDNKLDQSRIYRHLTEVYLFKGESKIALDYALKSLELQKQINNEVGIAKSLSLLGATYFSKGDLDNALKYSKQGIKSDKMSLVTKIETFHTLGVIYKEKGELGRALRYYNRAASLAEKNNEIEKHIAATMALGATYRMKGDYERATEYLKRSLSLSKDHKSLYGMNSSLFYLILTNLDKDFHEKAEEYLVQLEKFTNQTESKLFNQVYQILKALVLKKSARMRNRTQAEKMLKEITESEFTTPQFFLLTLVNLCDLYLEELSITNNPEVLDEIYPLIQKMLKISENQNSYLWLAETKLLQAKLALIQMEFDKSKHLLTQAQQIAEIHGLNMLAIKISSEHDKLLEQSNVWENLKKVGAPMSERIETAYFKGVIDRLQGKQAIDPPKLSNEKPVLLIIVGEGGVPLFSNAFVEDWPFDDGIVSGFLTAFDNFSGELFSKRLDRAKFGEYTILLQSVDKYSVYYLFKGQTYPASQKLKQFINRIKESTSLWKMMNKFYKANRLIELKDSVILESIINEIFVYNKSTLD
ncbi:MAG: tetratricopeptide repeat protein [Candidatus Thorarchaeota archaeon]